ncbi:MAG: phosphoribosyltransferase family protein [Planctomycetota bacterium]
MWTILADAFLLPGCAGCGNVDTSVGLSALGVMLCSCCKQDWPPAFGVLDLPNLQRLALWPYAGTVRRLIVQAKDQPHGAHAWALRRAAIHQLVRLGDAPHLAAAGEARWCVPPPSKQRRRADWYLPQFLCKPLASSLGANSQRLLVRRQTRGNQAELSGTERRANLQGVFDWRGGKVPVSVMLLDDVSTTGATLQEAARALRSAGVREVRALCLAVVE